MITIVVPEDEKKVKEILTNILRKEGYALMPDSRDQDRIFRIIKKDRIDEMTTLKDTVIQLEDSLYKEKQGILYKSILETIEKPLIERMLERTEGNQLKAAKILGINRNTMRAKIKKLGIDINRWRI